MISPGSLAFYNPRPLRKHALAYTRMRKRRARSRVRRGDEGAQRASASDLTQLFAHEPAEFPVATAVPREPRARAIAMLASFERWLAARWSWFRPRTVPCAVAALGMVAVMAAAHYLAHPHDQAPQGERIVRVTISIP